MSIIGPRPALWNQYDLIAERDKYGANDVLPGLTGWAQINGRDELPISVKAAYDGEYVKNMSFAFDCKCFFGIIGRVLKNGGNIKSLAIDWRTPAEKAWEEKYQAAAEMLQKMKLAAMADSDGKEKRTTFSFEYPPSHSIRQWLVRQRSLFRQGKLSSEQITKLSELNAIGANMSMRRHI